MKSLAERLDYLMKKTPTGKPVSQTTLAGWSGVSQPTIARILDGDSNGRPKTLTLLAEALSARPEFLIWGHGNPWIGPQPQTSANGNSLTLDNTTATAFRRIPVLGAHVILKELKLDEKVDLSIPQGDLKEFVFFDTDCSPFSFAYRVQDDSMLGHEFGLTFGSVAIIDPRVKPEIKDVILAKLNDHLLLGELQSHAGMQKIIPTNKRFDSFTIATNQILGTVIASFRRRSRR